MKTVIEYLNEKLTELESNTFTSVSLTDANADEAAEFRAAIKFLAAEPLEFGFPEATDTLRQIAEGAYCGIERKDSLFPTGPDFQTNYRAFIESGSDCSKCNRGSVYVQAEAKNLEDLLVKIAQELDRVTAESGEKETA